MRSSAHWVESNGAVSRYMTRDHVRLDACLARAELGAVDLASYEEFRTGLLRHIAIEEKVLFVAIRAQCHGAPPPLLAVLHADHAALASLLVPTPTPALLGTLRELLDDHNPLEETAEGLYDMYEQLGRGELDMLIARARAIPPVRASKHVDGPRVDEHVARMLAARTRIRAASPMHGLLI